ncbi:hypothetical protein Hanom_Chr12g01121021 [Helianthus anomalus]
MWLKNGVRYCVTLCLTKFKELFGSFTSHRVENRSTGTHYGSNGSENQKSEF